MSQISWNSFELGSFRWQKNVKIAGFFSSVRFLSYRIYSNKRRIWAKKVNKRRPRGIPYNQEKHYKTILKQHLTADIFTLSWNPRVVCVSVVRHVKNNVSVKKKCVQEY